MQTFNRANLISPNWQPEDMHYQMLEQLNIPRYFVDECVPGFILYWTERKKVEFSWGSKFVRHCIHEYRKSQVVRQVQQREVRMDDDWQPAKMAVDQLLNMGISITVIDAMVADFKIYWIERGDFSSTWSAKFLQFARQNAPRFSAHTSDTRDKTLVEHLTDRSWAD